MRAGIAGILSTAPGIEVTAEASDGVEALDLVRRHLLDVVLLDIQMPRPGGISTLEQLHRDRRETPVAMLTAFSDEAYIAEAIRLGALGFFLKSDDPHASRRRSSPARRDSTRIGDRGRPQRPQIDPDEDQWGTQQ